MGYYTTFNLKTTKGMLPQEVQELIERKQDDGDYLCGVCPDGSMADETKWYEHDEDMKEFSKNFPSIEFILSGEGEEQGDVWETHYQNGKILKKKRAKLVMEEV